MKLFEITDSIRELLSDLDENGEITDDVLAKLDSLQLALDHKVRGIIAVMQEQSIEADAIKSESARLGQIAKVRAKAYDRLRAYLQQCLEHANIPKVKTDLGTASLRESSRPSITWEGEGEVPEEFRRVRVELDGDAVYRAWKEDRLPEGFAVRRSKYVSVT